MLSGKDANPAGFKNVQPSRFQVIHFSTHAKAIPPSPLDSFLVLAPDANGNRLLYAHDLQALAIKADLVTLSACQTSGAKNIPGEGPVGLTWAVLSGETHNVIATLRSVSSADAARLMDRFYLYLDHGKPPAQALQAAKQDIASKNNASPYQWAAFQLYSR